MKSFKDKICESGVHLVWRIDPKTGAPRFELFKCNSLDAAIDSAKTWIKANPNYVAIILKPVVIVESEAPPIKITTLPPSESTPPHFTVGCSMMIDQDKYD